MPVPANFKGKKGRSGRKSLAEEVAKLEAIKKAWNKVNREIENKDVEKVALPIALKTMTDKSEVKTKVEISFDETFKNAITRIPKEDNSITEQIQDN